MGRVHLSGHLDVPPERVDAVRAALPQHIALTLAEPGCLAFTVVQNPSTPTRFDVSETFTDQAAFDQHQQRAQSSDWAAVTQGMLRHYTIRVEDP